MAGKKNRKSAQVERDPEARTSNFPSGKSAELAELFDAKNSDEQADLISTMQRISMSSSPVPPPEILMGYEEAVKNGGEWLLKYTKDEQDHRHELDRKQLLYFSLGQCFGFVLGLVGIGGGLYLATQGAQWFGFVAFFSTLVSLVGIFVYNKNSEEKK